MAIELIDPLQERGSPLEVVLADRLYGECRDVSEALSELKRQFVIAIRENHGGLLPLGQRLRDATWQEVDRVCSHEETETRWIRDIMSDQRRDLRDEQMTTDDEAYPAESTGWLMTPGSGNVNQALGQIYGMRTWID